MNSERVKYTPYQTKNITKVKALDTMLFPSTNTGSANSTTATIPSKETFYTALDLVEKVRLRDKILEDYKKEIAHHVKAFNKDQIIFKKYPKSSGFIFSGVLISNGKIKLGVSRCNKDPFTDVVGKLIAIRRALDIETDSIENFLNIYSDILHI